MGNTLYSGMPGLKCVFFFVLVFVFFFLLRWVFVVACGLLEFRHAGSRVLRLSRCGAGPNCPTARGALVPQPGVEPASPAVGRWTLITGPPGKCPGLMLSPVFISSASQVVLVSRTCLPMQEL